MKSTLTTSSKTINNNPPSPPLVTVTASTTVSTAIPKPSKSKINKDYENSLNPLALVHHDELAKIWDNDKRIPTVESRRAWALARNVKPDSLHRWYARQKHRLRKARRAMPKGTYDLPVGDPPVVHEPPPPPPPPMLVKIKAEALDSDDILVSDHASGVSSFSDETLVEDERSSLMVMMMTTRSSPSSLLSELESSSSGATPLVTPGSSTWPLFLDSITSAVAPPDLTAANSWCTQTTTEDGAATAFTCTLCMPQQTTPAESEPILFTPGNNNDDSEELLHRYYHCHYYYNANSGPMMELSALPFIFRSPDLMFLQQKEGDDDVVNVSRVIELDGNCYALDGSLLESRFPIPNHNLGECADDDDFL